MLLWSARCVSRLALLMPALLPGDRVARSPSRNRGLGWCQGAAYGRSAIARSSGGIALTLSPIEIHDALPGNDADSVRPGGPRFTELGNDVGPARCLVVKLSAIGVDLVELPRLWMFPHELPAVAPD